MELSQLSIHDQAELKRFEQVLSILRDAKAKGASRESTIRTACLEVYGDEFGDEPHVTGEEGVRDTQHPCADFKFGEPHSTNRCEGDGHYLCGGCANRKAPENGED